MSSLVTACADHASAPHLFFRRLVEVTASVALFAALGGPLSPLVMVTAALLVGALGRVERTSQSKTVHILTPLVLTFTILGLAPASYAGLLMSITYLALWSGVEEYMSLACASVLTTLTPALAAIALFSAVYVWAVEFRYEPAKRPPRGKPRRRAVRRPPEEIELAPEELGIELEEF